MAIQPDFTKEIVKMRQDALDEMKKSMAEMTSMADELRKAVDEMKENLEWGMWETHKLILPKRIKGKWYWPGDTVYRKQRFGPGGVHYKYGDSFDILKDT